MGAVNVKGGLLSRMQWRLSAARALRALPGIGQLEDHTAVYRWRPGREPRTLRPAGRYAWHARLGAWNRHCIGPLVARVFDQAKSVVTVQSFDDRGVLPDARWLELVRTEWLERRTAWLLVTGCGHADTDTPQFLVHPYHDMNGWDHYHEQRRSLPDWTDRRDSIVFRGHTTGAADLTADRILEDLPRARLLGLLRASGLPADLGFSRVVQARAGSEPAVRDRLAAAGLMAEQVSKRDMMAHRYQLMVDGNHGAWSAHVWKLISGSTCLWVTAPAVNWYDRCFEPWVHYIPVRPDGADLAERYRAARDDPGRSRDMAHACAERARTVFDRRFMFDLLAERWRATWGELVARF